MQSFVLLLIFIITAASFPQIEHGSVFGPSGRFQRTQNGASPPVDLNKPAIFLPEATPVHEVAQELETAGNHKVYKKYNKNLKQ